MLAVAATGCSSGHVDVRAPNSTFGGVARERTGTTAPPSGRPTTAEIRATTSSTAPAATTATSAPAPPSTAAAVHATTTTAVARTCHAVPATGVVYGPATLDVFPVSGNCRAPLVVYVHGGGYCCGTRADLPPSVIAWLHSQGWAVAAVDYRLGVRWPAFDDDIATAVAWLHSTGARYGIDAQRVVLLGHSTGAEMVAEIGADPQRLASAGLSTSAVRCVASFDGSAYDLAAAMPTAGANYRRAYGTDVSTWHRASAYEHARALRSTMRFLVVLRSGDGGAGRRAAQLRFATALGTNGTPVTTVDAESLGHGQVLSTIGNASSPMTAPLATFLRACA